MNKKQTRIIRLSSSENARSPFDAIQLLNLELMKHVQDLNCKSIESITLDFKESELGYSVDFKMNITE